MAKPILVIRTSNDYADSFDKIQKVIRKQMRDEYHVVLVGQADLENPVFEVFNVDKEEPIKYSELKKLISKEVESFPNPLDIKIEKEG